MRYRLVATYLVLLTLVLLALEIPLAANVAASRTQAVVIDRNADAARLASLADPALRTGETQTLTDELDRYYDLFDITAAVADRDGRLVASTGDPQVFDTPQVRGWLNQALAGERVGAGRTVWPWQHARLAIAVPVTTAGEVVGAVLTLSPVDKLQASIDRAREAAREAGVQDRVTFALASAKDYPGSGYDLVCVFDCLHDMGDPVGAARHVRQALADDGTWMVVEPFAGDRVEQNLNPVGRAYYAFSTLLCTPASLSQEVGLALGAQAGEARIGDVVSAGGFTRFRRAAETPFNLVFEARP